MRHATQRTDRLSSRVLTQAYLAGAGAAGFAGVVAAARGVVLGRVTVAVAMSFLLLGRRAVGSGGTRPPDAFNTLLY